MSELRTTPDLLKLVLGEYTNRKLKKEYRCICAVFNTLFDGGFINYQEREVLFGVIDTNIPVMTLIKTAVQCKTFKVRELCRGGYLFTPNKRKPRIKYLNKLINKF